MERLPRGTLRPRWPGWLPGIVLALALPAVAVPPGADNRYSPRLGIYYTLGPLGARLAHAPVPGSPLSQSQVQLERGDLITHLDDIPVTNAPSLENHHAQTSVRFVNIRTGDSESRTLFLPPMNAPGVPKPEAPEDDPGVVYTGHFSPRLGLFVEMVQVGTSVGAQLKGPPVPGSPFWQEQVLLQAGDLITHLDNVAVTGVAELEKHVGQSSVAYLHARTGRLESRWVYLTELAAAGVPRPIETPTLPRVAALPPEIPALFPLSSTGRVEP